MKNVTKTVLGFAMLMTLGGCWGERVTINTGEESLIDLVNQDQAQIAFLQTVHRAVNR